MNILFVCKWNRFRSRVAEAYFRKINKDPGIKIKSAGLIRGRPQNEMTLKAARKFGLDISKRPKGLSANLLLWSDLTIIVADDVPKKIFSSSRYYVKRFTVWKIKDAKKLELNEMERIIKEIIKKVDKLNKSIQQGDYNEHRTSQRVPGLHR